MMREGPHRRRVLLGIALLCLTAGAVAWSLSRDEDRVAPGVGGGARDADPTAGAALPEAARMPIPSDSTLVGRGPASALEATTESPPAAVPTQFAPPSPPPTESALPTGVTFLDAVTGREVPGVRWSAPEDRSLFCRQLLTSVAVPEAPPPGHGNGDVVTFAPPWGPLLVAPPPGWVYLGSKAIPSHRMPRAREGRMTVLLHPEVDVRVEILAPDGRVAAGARVSEAFVAGATIRQVREERAQDGTRRLRGIPYFAGEILQLMPIWAGPDAPAGIELPPKPSEDMRAMITMWRGPMPDRPETTIRAVIRLAGPIGPGDHNETDNDLPTEESLGEGGPPSPSATGTVRLHLLDRAGRPASKVQVGLSNVRGTTDEEGRAALEGVREGPATLYVFEAGWLFPPTPVTVVGRQVTDLVVREIVGGDVEIVVRDSDGNPVPFAALEVRRADGQTWYDVDDAGIQRLDPYVDVRGRRLLTHLPPGTLRVHAFLGTRKGVGEVEVVDRGRRVLPITVTR